MSEFEDKLQAILGDPDAMSQIMSLAQSIGGNAPEQSGPDTHAEEPASPFSMLGDLDPRLLQVGMQLLSEYNAGDDRKTALLTALRPFVRENRYAKVDQAIQIAKLSRIIRVAIDAFRKGDEQIV